MNEDHNMDLVVKGREVEEKRTVWQGKLVVNVIHLQN